MTARAWRWTWPLFCLPWVAHASDFDPTSTAWNGLNRLQAVAGLVDLQIQTRDRLDWQQVDERDVLVVVAPQVAPTGVARQSLVQFVEAGGRLIVADDFAEGAAWLAPFGLELVAENARFADHYAEQPGLPLATINPDPESQRLARAWQTRAARLGLGDFLAHELHKPIVLNHPAVIHLPEAPPDRPIVAWGRTLDPHAAWLAETGRGAGRVLALADPSVWLNAMLERFHENKQFAANVLRYYCVADRPCRVTLLANVAAVGGVFRPHHAPHRLGLRAGLEQLAEMIAQLAALLAGRLVAPALLIVVLLLIALPVVVLARTPRPIVPPEATPLRQRTALMETVAAWLGNLHADFRKPARLLAAHLQRRLAQLEREPSARDHGDPVAAMVRQGRVHPNAGPRLRSVLDGVRDAADGEDLPLSRARFGQLATDVEWAESLLAHTARRPAPEDFQTPPT